MIRVIVAEDHHLVRAGILALLEKADDIEVVGEAADGRTAVELAESLAPDVVLMDIRMPQMDGLQAAERLRLLNVPTKTVVLSMYSDETLVRQALRNGASGYLLKESVTAELLLAIRAAQRGELYLSPAISQAVVTSYLTLSDAEQESDAWHQLTAREREVLQLIVEGGTNAAIAQLIGVGVKTVEKHRSNLMAKLGVRDVAGLVRVALRHRLVLSDD